MSDPDLIRMRDPEQSVEARIKRYRAEKEKANRIALLESELQQTQRAFIQLRQWAIATADALSIPRPQ